MYNEFKVVKPLQILSFYTADEQIFDNNHYFPGEAHDFWEMVCVLEGNVTVNADERVYNLRKNDIIFHKPMEVHKFRVNTAKTRMFIMSFSAAGVFLEKLERSIFRIDKEQEEYLEKIRDIIRSEDNVNLENKNFLVAARNNPEKFQVFLCECEIFLLTLVNKYEPRVENNGTMYIYKEAIRFMKKNIHKQLSVEEVAEQCHVSVAYLKKIFSEYAGEGVHKRFLNMQIKYAAKMILEGENVNDVAEKLSFSSQNYFSIAFKREMGVSPMMYKKMKKHGKN